ncbi:MAG TPA: ABC transporter ATP-binding protein [Nocardioidaceae bacterium]|nr:ABC transporter ATP-binding protein [Nocardioidaceae bacterium]
MSDLALEVSGLSKQFREHTAVEDLTFVARRGDVLGLLGPNGAGKTTTIRLLTTVLSPTSGTFEVDGVPASRPDRIRRRVGVLAESAGYPRSHTGEEYLRYHARLFGLTRADADASARRLLGEVGLADRASSRIASYSRGMRQRLGIARALVNDPAVVFLDEPTLGLDPAGQRQMLAMVADIAHRRQATVVFSSHALAEVEEVCSSLLILERGRTIASGTVDEVIRAVSLPPSARLQVSSSDVAEALRALRREGSEDGMSGVIATVLSPAQGSIRLSTRMPPDGPRAAQLLLTQALETLVVAQIPVLSFEIEGTRLSDAFLAMTGDTP